MVSLKPNRTAGYKPGLAWFCALPLLAATCLLYAGGVTTSIEAGMAFLDWPLSDGSLNPEGWTQDRLMRAEHSHRLLGMAVGLLAIILVFWTWLREERRWVRSLTRVTLLIIILQGVLGGARVRFDQLNILSNDNFLAQGFAVLHALGAQVTICLLVTIAVAASRFWIERQAGLREPVEVVVSFLGGLACLLLIVQVLIGAIVRHTEVGLAISTFPHSTLDGRWLPLHWNWAVAVNFAHRVGALVVTAAILAFVGKIWSSSATRHAFGRIAVAPLLLLAVQITLGATVIWTGLNEHAATFHMLFGAFLLAACWMLTFLTFRLPRNGIERFPGTEQSDTT